MNINGIGTTSTIDALTALNSTANPDASQGTSGTSTTPAASANVSKPGELMSKLSQLLQQDPAKFKQVTQQISDELKSAAQNASGPQASFLNKLSENFAQASSSGSLSSLQPPQGSGVPGRHHHQGGGHGGGAGPGGAIESVISTALDQVNQALSGTTGSGASSTSVQ
jgi:hypothetical protein